jgi:hypothetical protein
MDKALTNSTEIANLAFKGRWFMSKMTLAKASIYLAAFISFLFSVYLWFKGYKNEGLFVGMWVPSILSLGALMFVSRRVK